MPKGREKIGNAILKIDHAIKENRLFMDIILINPHNYSMSQWSQLFYESRIYC